MCLPLNPLAEEGFLFKQLGVLVVNHFGLFVQTLNLLLKLLVFNLHPAQQLCLACGAASAASECVSEIMMTLMS